MGTRATRISSLGRRRRGRESLSSAPDRRIPECLPAIAVASRATIDDWPKNSRSQIAPVIIGLTPYAKLLSTTVLL